MKHCAIYLAVSVLFSLFFVTGCASQPETRTEPANIAAPLSQGQEKASWELEWERSIQQGKKEAKAVIYVNLGKELIESWRKTFTQKFGIDLEFVAGRSTELAEKVSTERRAGLYLVDAFIGGATTSMYLKSRGISASSSKLLILPDVIDPKVWWEGKIPYLDRDGHILAFRASPNTPFVVNTQQVRPGEVKSYKDLLNARWKNKIIINDPSVAGSGHDLFYLVAKNIYSMDYWREMVRLEPVISREQRIPVEWVARGKYAIGMGLKADVIAEFQTAGAPLESLLPSEGTYITPGAGTFLLIDSPPHPQAIKVFANWLLTREGLELMSRAQLVQSARVDVPVDFLPKDEIRDPEAKYYLQHTEEIILEKEKYMDIAREIFAPVMK